MSSLTPAQQEALYDAQRSGAAYLKPEPADKDVSGAVWDEIIDVITSDPWEPVLAIADDPADDGREHDTPLSADEARALDILLANVVVVPSRDQAHREERLVSILERIADMPEPQQSEMIEYMMRALEMVKGK